MATDNYKSFNGTVEIGTRVCLILSALDSLLNIDDLVKLDYALLYSEEFQGPENLHPALPNHLAEIAHRREWIPQALTFLVKKGLADLVIEKNGHFYKSNENTLQFISCLQSTYYKKAWPRLNWISENKNKIIKTRLSDLTKSLS